MESQKVNVSKLCSFYVSDWHLVTMLLPYISKNIKEGTKIATILEKDIEENIYTLLERLNLKEEEQIKKINWKNINEKKYTTVNKLMEGNLAQEELVIVNGSKDFIKRANENINKYIEKNKEKLNGKNIKIVDCYEIIEFNGNINDILDNHNKILNTSGEKEINEIFEDYKKEEKIG